MDRIIGEQILAEARAEALVEGRAEGRVQGLRDVAFAIVRTRLGQSDPIIERHIQELGEPALDELVAALIAARDRDAVLALFPDRPA